MFLKRTEPESMIASSMGAGKNTIVKTKKTRKKWKKPKDKPKRPLSAYNIFFRHERANLMHNMAQCQENFGKVGFAALAKHIAAKWKQLDPEPRKIYEAQAEIEQQRYKVLLEEWRRKQNSGYGSSKDLLAPSPFSLLEKSKMPDLPSSSSCTKVSPSASCSNSLPLPKKERHATQNKTLNARRSSLPLSFVEESSSLSDENLSLIGQVPMNYTWGSMPTLQKNTLTFSPPVDISGHEHLQFQLPCEPTTLEKEKVEEFYGLNSLLDICFKGETAAFQNSTIDGIERNCLPLFYQADEDDMSDLYQFLKSDTDLLDT